MAKNIGQDQQNVKVGIWVSNASKDWWLNYGYPLYNDNFVGNFTDIIHGGDEDGANVTILNSSERVRSGSSSMKIAYSFNCKGSPENDAIIDFSPKKDWRGACAISLWIYGDGEGYGVYLQVYDNKCHTVVLIPDLVSPFSGWRHFFIELSEFGDVDWSDIRQFRLVIYKLTTGIAGISGSLYLDQVLLHYHPKSWFGETYQHSLRIAGIPYELISDDDIAFKDLSQYLMIIADNVVAIPENLNNTIVRKIVSYVNDGGTLIVGGHFLESLEREDGYFTGLNSTPRGMLDSWLDIGHVDDIPYSMYHLENDDKFLTLSWANDKDDPFFEYVQHNQEYILVQPLLMNVSVKYGRVLQTYNATGNVINILGKVYGYSLLKEISEQLSNCDATADWEPGYRGTDNITTDTVNKAEGNGSLLWSVNKGYEGTWHEIKFNPAGKWDWSEREFLSLWIYGDGSNRIGYVYIIDDVGNWRNYFFFYDFEGWKRFTFPIDQYSRKSDTDINLTQMELIKIVYYLSPEPEMGETKLRVDDINIGRWEKVPVETPAMYIIRRGRGHVIVSPIGVLTAIGILLSRMSNLNTSFLLSNINYLKDLYEFACEKKEISPVYLPQVYGLPEIIDFTSEKFSYEEQEQIILTTNICGAYITNFTAEWSANIYLYKGNCLVDSYRQLFLLNMQETVNLAFTIGKQEQGSHVAVLEIENPITNDIVGRSRLCFTVTETRSLIPSSVRSYLLTTIFVAIIGILLISNIKGRMRTLHSSF